jgi:ABC-2 type transport system permease protein
MSTAVSTTPIHRPTSRRSALRRLTVTEGKLLLREPLAVFWGIAFPIVLMTVMGLLASTPQADLGGLRLVDVYEPTLIAFVIAVFALQGMPTVLAGYRERGILRRLATTPVGPVRVLGAQLAVNLAVTLTTTAGILAVGRLAFDVTQPAHPLGFLATLALLASAMLAAGLLIAALAPTGRSANAIGAILFFPMMFFAGLWLPHALMPPTLQQVSDYTPLGAGVRAMQGSIFGGGPPLPALAVLAVYAAVCAVLARRFFRWQ